MKNKFDVREYVDKVYGEKVLEWFEEDYGLNGLDRLWGCKDEEEVDDMLDGYCL